MRNFKIAVALVAVCVGGSAYALPPTATYEISLVVAGGSAQREAFRSLISSMCRSGTFSMYQATPAANQDFRAYSCTLSAGTPSIAGRNAIVYYRSEGGAVYGVGPLAKNIQVSRLLVNTACVSAGTELYNCPVSGYNLTTDTATSGNLVKSLVDLGVSDVEPSRFVGENWPASGTSLLGAEPTATQLNTLASQTTLGTVYGVLVNSNVPVADLSRQDVAAIFNGNYGLWSQVADPSNAVDATGEITVCRGVEGSGAQVAASIYFNDYGCPIGDPFVTAPIGPIFENPVIESATDTAMSTCIATHPNSIGVQTYTATAPTGTKWVTINGKAPSKLAAALGDYDFWFESTFNKDEVVAAKPLENALADFIVSRARVASTIPVNDSTLALYNSGVNLPVIPVASDRPIALGTRDGNSCRRSVGTF